MKLLLPYFFALIRKDFVGLDQINSTTQLTIMGSTLENEEMSCQTFI